MWIVRIALRRPYTFVVLALLILMVGPAHDRPHADRHLPQHQHPGRHRRLELRGPVGARRWPTASSPIYERDADHDGQRHRAHRVAVAARHRGRQGLLPAGREHRPGGRAGHRGRRSRSCASCRPARTPPLILTYNASTRADPAARAVGQEAVRAAAVRPRRELPPHAAGHACTARRSRIRTAASSRRSRSTSIPTALQAQGPRRRPTWSTRSAPQNLILPGGTSKIGALEYDVDLNAQPADGRGAERSADQDGRRRRRSTSATSRTCATASRRRPTSSASTASARRC